MSLGREKDQKYSAKWRSFVNFIQHNTGLGVGSVAKAGSRREGTPSLYSDLDIIFYIPGDPRKQTIYPKLVDLILKNFPEAKAEIGQSYIVINMTLENLEFDIVLLEEYKFRNQVQNYKLKKM